MPPQPLVTTQPLVQAYLRAWEGDDIITTNSHAEARSTDRHANQHVGHIHAPQYSTFSNVIAHRTEHPVLP